MLLMNRIKVILTILAITALTTLKGTCADLRVNDLKQLYTSNNAIIYAINIRSFNAKDLNNNGIIEEEQGEERGNFVNAIQRLDDLKSAGINTVMLLPITSVGRVKALGTAGSLFAASSFNEINPQLKAPNSNLSLVGEMRQFVEECHKRGLRVMVDLPPCGAYDLYLKHPELFVKDANQNPVIPSDWTDVRLLNAGTNEQINMDVYNLYAEFIDLMIELNVDGIRADVASIKPYSFWKKLIDETRSRNPQFLFLAETSTSCKDSPCKSAPFTPYNKLLEAGFDGYYGDYANLKNWKTARELYSAVKSDLEIAQKSSNTKAVLGNFATHDQISPILVNGKQLSTMIIWLSATLPLNSYFIDGFPTGDEYIYPWANKKAAISYTDDDYYFAHRGQMDIFNFSRKPGGKSIDIEQEFVAANKFKSMLKNSSREWKFFTLRTSSPHIFAYARCNGSNSIIVMGNLDFKNDQKATIYIPKMSNELISMPVKVMSIPKISKGKIDTSLAPGEVQVLLFNSLKFK